MEFSMFKDTEWILIFNHLSLNDLINKCSLISRSFNELIHSHQWDILVKLTNLDDIRHVIRNYHFISYDLSKTKITDDDLEFLSHCRSLNLSSCVNLTEKGFRWLRWVETLNVSECGNIRKGLKYLINLRDINLDGCYIDDEDLQHLRRCHTIHLRGLFLSDLSLMNLHSVRNLYLPWCRGFSDEGLRSLFNVHTLHIMWNRLITSKGYGHLMMRVHELKLDLAHVDEEGMKCLKVIPKLHVTNRDGNVIMDSSMSQ